MIPATMRGKAILRFVVCSRLTESTDIERSWAEIASQGAEVLRAEAGATNLVLKTGVTSEPDDFLASERPTAIMTPTTERRMSRETLSDLKHLQHAVVNIIGSNAPSADRT